MIDIFIPVLGRPQNAEPVARSISEHTTVPHRVLFICSKGDDEEIDACQATGADVMVMSHRAERSDYPRKMNAAYRDTDGEFMLMGSDDITFGDEWDVRALSVAESTGAGVVATNDMANAHVKRGKFGTHALVNREYVVDKGGSADGPGVLIHEGYDHNFCDRELCHLAQSRKLYAFARTSYIYHRHPHWRTAPNDATYEKGTRNFRADQTLFLERAKLWGYIGLAGNEVTAAVGRKRRKR